MTELERLNDEYALQQGNNYLRFIEGKGGLPVAEVNNNQARATISLQGAHLLSWIPVGDKEVIWLSDAAKFEPGKAIRGGIPICWPWFGAHGSLMDGVNANSGFPAHGFVRTANWQVLAAEDLEGDRTRLTLTTQPRPENAPMWPQQTTLQFQLTIGKKLEIELITHNNSSQPVKIGQALHTYFRVGDIGKVVLHGLEDTDYLDKLEDYKLKRQTGPITINEEVDRIYLNTGTDCLIEDRALKRNIIINKCGSNSTVVWNPWQESASKMGDMGDAGYRTMLCVETANAATDVVTIEPGKAHHLWVKYEIQKAGLA